MGKFPFLLLLLIGLFHAGSFAANLSVPLSYPSLAAAVLAAAAGDTIIVEPGTYDVRGLVINKPNLTIASRYHLSGAQSDVEATVLRGGGATIFTTVAGQSAGFVLKGFKITGAYKPVVINDQADIQHNHFFDNDSDTVSFEDSGYGSVRFNLIELAGDDGIDVDSRRPGGYFAVEYNTVLNSGDDGIEIRLYSMSGTPMTYQIYGNQFSGSGEDGIQLIDYAGATPRTFNIERNILSNNSDAGLGTMSDGNTIENFAGAPMAERAYVVNNTISGNNVGLTGGANMIAINNLLVNNRTSGAQNLTGSSVLAHSLLFNNGTNLVNAMAGAGIITNDPLMSAATFQLQGGSPAIDKGVASFSLNGVTVVSLSATSYSGLAPDLGAKEYAGVMTPPPPVNQAPAVNAGQDQVTLLNQILLDASATDDGLPGPLTFQWSMIQGPAPVEFTSPASGQTSVKFSLQGIYRLRFTASDGALSSSDDVVIRYVSGGDGHADLIRTDAANILEAENFAYLYGTAKNQADNLASMGMAVRAPEGMGTYAFTEHRLNTTASSASFYMFIRARSGPALAGALDVSVNNNAVVRINVPADAYTWIRLPAPIVLPAGNWPMIIRAATEGVWWDQIAISTSSTFNPEPAPVPAPGPVPAPAPAPAPAPVPTVQALDVSIAAGSDDAEEFASGSMYINSSDLELVTDGSKLQTVGLRFKAAIPQGAKIRSAYIQFTADEKSTIATDLMIYGQASDNAATFTSSKQNISSRPKTAARVVWKPESWSTVGAAGSGQRTPDLAAIIQEVVSRPNWISGQGLAVLVTGTGRRTAESYEGASSSTAKRARLHIEFEK